MKTISSHFNEKPRTKFGWWAVWLAAASFVLLLAWSILPGGAILSFLCGLAGGIIALIAVIRHHERSWLVFLSILPLLNVFIFILDQFPGPALNQALLAAMPNSGEYFDSHPPHRSLRSPSHVFATFLLIFILLHLYYGIIPIL